MRLSTILQVAGALALVAGPALAEAAPLRAASSLPSKGTISTASTKRAPTASADKSNLIGTPIYLLIALFGGGALVAVLASGGGRSPG